MKNKGFTLIELLAVIVILAVLALVGTVAVLGIVNSSRENANKITMENLSDAAVTYGLNKLFIQDKCALDKEVDDSNFNSISMPSGCDKNLVTVQFLIDNNYFTDNKNTCQKNKQVLIYKYHYKTHDDVLNKDKDYYDIKAYVPKDICKN